MKVGVAFSMAVSVSAWGSSLGFLSRRPLRGQHVADQPQGTLLLSTPTSSGMSNNSSELAGNWKSMVTDLHRIAREKVDADGDGHLDHSELVAFSMKLREKERHASTAEEMARWDSNRDGSVELMELHGDLGSLPESDVIRRALKSMKEKFLLCDRDRDNRLSREELMIFLHPELDPDALALEARQQFDHLDRNRDGFVVLGEDQVEFGSLAGDDSTQLTPSHMDVKEFKLHDHNNDERLSLKEMEELVAGHKYVHGAIEEFMGGVDRDSDGRISLHEFESHDHHKLIDSIALEDWLYHSHDEL
mmetsp:Transcript_70554/g.187975  ORF Transcript_70554/g.187975 Transcript_70554/m.187975 type:complete len:304 (+) Transcript_70554:192-1103(+)